MSARVALIRVASVLGLALTVGCGVRGPEPTRYPSEEQVVADHRAIGVPYGRFVLFRDGDRLVAVELSPRAARGERIHYRWAISPSGSSGFSGSESQQGEAETFEQQGTGLISVPGLNLRWSRGSAELGWIYWPKDGREFSVYSRPWLELEDIDAESREGKWLRRKQFRR